MNTNVEFRLHIDVVVIVVVIIVGLAWLGFPRRHSCEAIVGADALLRDISCLMSGRDKGWGKF